MASITKARPRKAVGSSTQDHEQHPPPGRAALVAVFRGSGTHAASLGQARSPSGPPPNWERRLPGGAPPTNPPPTHHPRTTNHYPPTHHPRTTHPHLTKSSSALSLSLPIWYTYFASFGRTLQDSPVMRPAVGRWIHQNREARLFVRKRETNERTEEQNWTQSARRHLLAVKREGCQSLCRRRNDG